MVRFNSMKNQSIHFPTDAFFCLPFKADDAFINRKKIKAPHRTP